MISSYTVRTLRVCFFSAIASAALASCGRAGIPSSMPLGSRPLAGAARNTGQNLIAFSPNGTPSIGVFSAASSGRVEPSRLLQGSKTTLAWGNSAGVDSSGEIYAIVGSPLRLLQFGPHAAGNAAPEHVVDLPKKLLSGYVVGFAPDNRGNFFISDGPDSRVLRFPILKQGSAKANAAFVPVLTTPMGPLAARPGNVSVGPHGILYVLASVVEQGNVWHGVSQYSVDAAGHAKLVRSFTDTSLPEAPPSSIAVDSSGTLYLAGGLDTNPIFAYAPAAQSGLTHYSRAIGFTTNTAVSSIATDNAGQLYVALKGHIDVFAADANGLGVKPVRALWDVQDLQYGNNAYGSLLTLTR